MGKDAANLPQAQHRGNKANQLKPKTGGSRSTHDFQVDKNMKAQFNVTHNTRKRNQPLKININMTGGSGTNNNG